MIDHSAGNSPPSGGGHLPAAMVRFNVSTNQLFEGGIQIGQRFSHRPDDFASSIFVDSNKNSVSHRVNDMHRHPNRVSGQGSNDHGFFSACVLR